MRAGVEVDGEALQRLPHQPRGRRRRGSRDQREDARSDRRPRSGAAQRPGRHLARADGGRRARRGALDAAARPRPHRPVRQRHAEHRRQDGDRAEVIQLATEIKSIADDTEFNGKPLFGATGGSRSRSAPTTPRRSRPPRPTSPARSPPAASASITSVDTAGEATTLLTAAHRARRPSTPRSRTSPRSAREFGAVQNRLEHRLNNLATYQENLTASESRIRDVDMASEMTKFTKLNILQQAGTSMLAQANQAPAGRPVAAARLDRRVQRSVAAAQVVAGGGRSAG